MKVPTPSEAEELLAEASRLNPGQWVDHCEYVALAARLIAERLPQMDSDFAYSMGLLHDIGRRVGVVKNRHVIEGYKYLNPLGYVDAARICLTHSFPVRDFRVAIGPWDCPDEDVSFIKRFIDGIEYDDYDRLFQLCDALALPTGICTLEKRFVDVSLRYGFNDWTVRRWQATLDIKSDFEGQIGESIYKFLPGVAETTLFG